MAVNDEILAIKDIIVNIVDPEKVYLFGSYAYGVPNKNSDYDFYVVLKDDSSIKPMDAMGLIDHKLIRFDTLMPIDVLANYKKRFEYRSTQPTMERKIMNEGILLYERY